MSMFFQDATDKRLSKLEKASRGLRNLWLASVKSRITGVLAALIFLPLFNSPASAACSPVGVDDVICDTNDTDGFASGGDITDFTINEGVTVDDRGTDVAGDGIIDIDGDLTGTLLNNGIINDATNPDPDDGVNVFGTLNALINNGTITGGYGVFVLNTLDSLINSGTITGGNDGVNVFGTLNTLINSGTITGGDDGVFARTITRLINSGTITGVSLNGVLAVNINGLTNSGTIQGDTFAIQESSSVDTQLTLNAGSILIGRVDLGGGTNTLNIGEGLSLNSTFESDGGATLFGLGTTGGQLVALIPVTGNDVQVVAVDTSAFASFDDALAALTSGFGGAVQSRQSAVRSDPALGFASTFTSRFAAADETSLAAFSDLNLDDAPHLNPNRFWIEGFGAYRQDQGDGVGGDFDSLTGGLVAGVDVPLDAITSIGVMAGFSLSTSENEIDTQTTDATSYFGGIMPPPRRWVWPGMLR